MMTLHALAKIKARRAMTLLEIMIAGTLSSTVGIGAVKVMVLIHRSTAQSAILNQVNQESRFIADLISREIRGASHLESAYDTFTAGPDVLIVATPSLDENWNVIDAENVFDRVIFHPATEEPHIIVREVIPAPGSIRPPDSRRMITSAVDMSYAGTFSVEPDALGAFVVHYQFTASRNLGERPITMPISGSVRLRNRL